jgi:hypothetical protein
MRVISQDGRTDIPYENFVFGITKDNSIVAIRDTIARPSEIAHGVVATYSTEEKAKKAMEMLRIAYTGSIAMFQNVEPTEEVNEVFKKCNTQVIYASLDNQPSEIKFENHQNFYFQFPTEEELE